MPNTGEFYIQTTSGQWAALPAPPGRYEYASIQLSPVPSTKPTDIFDFEYAGFKFSRDEPRESLIVTSKNSIFQLRLWAQSNGWIDVEKGGTHRTIFSSDSL